MCTMSYPMTAQYSSYLVKPNMWGNIPTEEKQEGVPFAVWKRRGAYNLRRYKTEICRQWNETGECKYGVDCVFAHGKAELKELERHPKYKTQLCRNYHSKNPTCTYGVRCRYIHDLSEARTYWNRDWSVDNTASMFSTLNVQTNE